MVTLPKLKLGELQNFITSDAVLTAGSAILFTPLFLKSIEAIVRKVPFLANHFTIGLTIAAFVIFIIASKIGGKPRVIIIGIAAGVFITAIAPVLDKNFIGRFQFN